MQTSDDLVCMDLCIFFIFSFLADFWPLSVECMGKNIRFLDWFYVGVRAVECFLF